MRRSTRTQPINRNDKPSKMNVRKQRQHQCGLSNIDFRTKGDQLAQDRYNPNMKFADVGTMSKHGFK